VRSPIGCLVATASGSFSRPKAFCRAEPVEADAEAGEGETAPQTGQKRASCTIGERLQRWQRTALLGHGEDCRQVPLWAPFSELLAEFVYSVAVAGRYLGNGEIQINDARDLCKWMDSGARAPLRGVLRACNPISWFHAKGIHRVLARLVPRLPDVAGCLFLTFTVNPALYSCPSTAFDHARDRLRRVEEFKPVSLRVERFKMDGDKLVVSQAVVI
jgi:hypothetical protein